MMPLRALLGSLALVAVLAVPRPGRPCSYVPPVDTGGASPVAGPRPLLAAEDPAPLHALATGRRLPTVEVTAPLGLEDAEGMSGRPLRWFQPAVALAPGAYEFAFRGFEVREAPPPPPALGPAAELRLTVEDDEPQVDGCSRIMSCGPSDRLIIHDPDLTGEAAEGRFLVTLETADGRRYERLIRDAYGAGGGLSLQIAWVAPDVDLAEDSVCVTVRGVSGGGALSAARDLGCSAPETEGGGCATGARGPRTVPVLLLLVAGLAVRRSRRRSR